MQILGSVQPSGQPVHEVPSCPARVVIMQLQYHDITLGVIGTDGGDDAFEAITLDRPNPRQQAQPVGEAHGDCLGRSDGTRLLLRGGHTRVKWQLVASGALNSCLPQCDCCLLRGRPASTALHVCAFKHAMKMQVVSCRFGQRYTLLVRFSSSRGHGPAGARQRR